MLFIKLCGELKIDVTARCIDAIKSEFTLESDSQRLFILLESECDRKFRNNIFSRLKNLIKWLI